MPAIKWLPEAIADIARLHEFLLSKNPNAAARAAAAILDGADFLGANPLVGRPMRDETDRRDGSSRSAPALMSSDTSSSPMGQSPSFAYGIAAKSAYSWPCQRRSRVFQLFRPPLALGAALRA